MDEDTLALRRTQMGLAIQGWTAEPPAIGEVGTGYWVNLSGAPSPDVNMVLVHTADPAGLGRTVELVAVMACPTMLMLAGPGKGTRSSLDDGWQAVGSLPFMSIDLDEASRPGDVRVRQAGANDYDVVVDLIAAAYGMAREIAGLAAEPLRRSDDVMKTWLLVEDGHAVSTVITCAVDDTVSVWCMATPPRFERRGFGRALLADVLGRGREGGAEIGLLGATPAGRPLYEATGWTVLEEWDLYLKGESAQFPL